MLCWRMAYGLVAVSNMGTKDWYFHNGRTARLWKKHVKYALHFMNKMSRSAFAVYILHPFVLVVLLLLLKDGAVDPAIKFLIVAPLGVIASFLPSYVALKIQGVNQAV